VKYLPLFHHFKAIYQFPKHIFLVKIVANATLRCPMFISIEGHSVTDFDTQSPYQTTRKFIGCGPVPISLAVVLSVLRYTDSDYPFGIFKLFLFTNGDCVSKSVTDESAFSRR
jgi:hypothetical protein